MIIIYNYGMHILWWQLTHAPPSDPIQQPLWSAGAMLHTSNNGRGPELHSKPLDAAIGQVLTQYHPSRQQGHMQEKTRENAPYLLAVLLAIVMGQYNTKHIVQWRGSRASNEATGCRHRASIAANRAQWDIPIQQYGAHQLDKWKNLRSWRRAIEMIKRTN